MATAAANAHPNSVITKMDQTQHIRLERRHSKSQSAFNYDNTSSNLAANTMRNELRKLVETAPPAAKEVIIPIPTSSSSYSRLLTRRNSALKWTTSLLSSRDISATRQKEMKCRSRYYIDPNSVIGNASTLQIP